MGRVRKIHSSDRKRGFLFVGNYLALDFLNTCPLQNGAPTELIADFSALLRWFAAAELISARDGANLQEKWGHSARGQRVTENMRELREKLRQEILAWEHGDAVRRSTVSVLNRWMNERPMLTRLKRKGSAVSTELWFPVREPEDLFAPLAFSATTLFTSVDWKRVRKCNECVLHFQDTSKKGTRRWCSMRLCGNRLKVAAYASRQRMRRRRMTKTK